MWFYAGKLAWPTDLAVIYPRWDISLGDPWAWLYLAGAAAMAATLWFMRHRVGRGPLAGALFFAVTLSPVLGFVNHGYMQYSLVADRFQYLAGIGVMAVLIGAAVHGAGRLPGRLKSGATGLMVVLLALLGTATWRQAGIYRDGVTFYSHIVSLNPEARSAHYNLSIQLDRAGRPEEALAAARIAVEKRPDHAGAYAILGAALIHTERFVEAEEILRRALEIDPGHKGSRREMAKMLRVQGRRQEALEAYRAVLEIDPKYALAHAYIGDILVQLHRYAEAVKPLRKALRLIKAAPSVTPDLPTRNLFMSSWVRPCGAGADPGGGGALPAALQLDPRNMDALEHVAASYFRRKRYRQALVCIGPSWRSIPTRQPLTPTSAQPCTTWTGRKKPSGAWNALSPWTQPWKWPEPTSKGCKRPCGNQGSSGLKKREQRENSYPRRPRRDKKRYPQGKNISTKGHEETKGHEGVGGGSRGPPGRVRGIHEGRKGGKVIHEGIREEPRRG